MGRLFRASIPHTSRFFSNLSYRLLFVLIVFALFAQQHLFFVYQAALAAKYSPTTFPASLTEEYSSLWTPEEESAHLQDRLVANHATWRTLSKGFEGETFIYQDSVIKTFTPGRSPFRNCASAPTSEQWPTEIPASLFFGKLEHNMTSLNDGFMTVRAYFKASSSTDEAEWHLVTPLLEGGSLIHLAAKERNEKNPYQAIDARYRPPFNNLITTLQALHTAGYCHDDIKPANIFVASSSRWVLGDLGNLRQVSHAYHSSILWKENKQLENCKANDALRLLKSYMRFIRDSSINPDAFNKSFFDQEEPLSRWFWSSAAKADRLSASELYEDSASLHPQLPPQKLDDGSFLLGESSTWLSILSQRWGRHYAVNRVLQTRMGEKMARWWALTWLFGVPVKNTCGG